MTRYICVLLIAALGCDTKPKQNFIESTANTVDILIRDWNDATQLDLRKKKNELGDDYEIISEFVAIKESRKEVADTILSYIKSQQVVIVMEDYYGDAVRIFENIAIYSSKDTKKWNNIVFTTSGDGNDKWTNQESIIRINLIESLKQLCGDSEMSVIRQPFKIITILSNGEIYSCYLLLTEKERKRFNILIPPL